jgi:hypothetical protein
MPMYLVPQLSLANRIGLLSTRVLGHCRHEHRRASEDEPYSCASMGKAVVNASPATTAGVEVHLGNEKPLIGIDRLDVRDMPTSPCALDARRKHDGRARLWHLFNWVPTLLSAYRPGPGVPHPAQIAFGKPVILSSALLRPIGALAIRPPVIAVWTGRIVRGMTRNRRPRIRWRPWLEGSGRDL